MKIITIVDGAVASVESLPEGTEIITTEDAEAPRVGAIRGPDGRFVSPGFAIVVDDETGLVEQVYPGRWHDEQAPQDGKTWHQVDKAPPAGAIMGKDGELTVPPPPRDLAAEVPAHALALKIGVVNATRTDGGPAYPATAEALAAIRERYTEIVNETSAKAVMGEEVTTEEKQVVGLIRAGFAFFKAVSPHYRPWLLAAAVHDRLLAERFDKAFAAGEWLRAVRAMGAFDRKAWLALPAYYGVVIWTVR